MELHTLTILTRGKSVECSNWKFREPISVVRFHPAHVTDFILSIADELEVGVHVIILLHLSRQPMFSDSHILVSVRVAAAMLFWTMFVKQQRIPCSKLQELEQVQNKAYVRECCK
jgi:hypothetical protein